MCQRQSTNVCSAQRPLQKVSMLGKKAYQQQMKAISELMASSPNDPQWQHLGENVFRTFDLDGSGEVDQKEFRDFLEAFFPAMPRKLALATQKEIRHLYDSNGQLNVGSFLDALLISHQFVSSNAKKVGYDFGPAFDNIVKRQEEAKRKLKKMATETSGYFDVAAIMGGQDSSGSGADLKPISRFAIVNAVHRCLVMMASYCTGRRRIIPFGFRRRLKDAKRKMSHSFDSVLELAAGDAGDSPDTRDQRASSVGLANLGRGSVTFGDGGHRGSVQYVGALSLNTPRSEAGDTPRAKSKPESEELEGTQFTSAASSGLAAPAGPQLEALIMALGVLTNEIRAMNGRLPEAATVEAPSTSRDEIKSQSTAAPASADMPARISAAMPAALKAQLATAAKPCSATPADSPCVTEAGSMAAEAGGTVEPNDKAGKGMSGAAASSIAAVSSAATLTGRFAATPFMAASRLATLSSSSATRSRTDPNQPSADVQSSDARGRGAGEGRGDLEAQEGRSFDL